MPVPSATAARRHLARADGALAGLMRRTGTLCLPRAPGREPYAALVSAIAYQQLHARAAEAILGRLTAPHGGAVPPPAVILSLTDAEFRACGFSGPKAAAIRAIATGALAGVIPTRRQAARLADEALIGRLVSLRGVGRWTVEMLLISTLGRPDVLPVDDFGVREGYRLIHGLAAQPKPRAFAEIGRAYAPYRSFAALYLWRAANAAKLT